MADRAPAIVIVGASGDLTARKLVPSLYRAALKKRLPEGVRVVGVARSPLTDDSFRARMAEAVREFAKKDWSEEGWTAFAGRLSYVAGDAAARGGLNGLRDWLAREGIGSQLYYLAVAPNLYAPIVTNLGETGLSREDGG